MSTETNIFELAARQKVRFETVRGVASVEQLWDMPLSSRDGFDLDTLAKAVNTQLKAAGEESFVTTKANPLKNLLELMLELIKHVIAYKLAQKADAAARADRKAKREKLMDLLAKKQDAALEGLSEEDIKAQLAALDD